MKQNIVSFIVGLIFAAGLAVSGMTQPQKVIGFLDLFGNWDPSLVFVMGGAIFVHALVYFFATKKPHPIFDTQWNIPTKKEITPALIIGSTLFGMGWGLGGFCPGPALTSLGTLSQPVFVFVGSMIVGMLVFKFADAKLKIKR